MDRLRSPGGCPWDAEQTHRSLAPYAIEEAYELAEAAEAEDRAALRGELGDLLLQVVFHARVAQEHPQEPFDLADVAQELLDKLHRRHPHVFADAAASSAAEVETAWHEIKKQEREGQDVLTGIPVALPALARAQKIARRLRREGSQDAELLGPADPAADPEAALGRELMALVLRADAAGLDAEAALRAHLRGLQGRRSGPA
ncbi:MazG family protein [Georgenia wutianyii]|uniref:MazG family protein n=2 Tax=Georgenia wutianyii TaxID=2585135 RepID=A0ABX5VQU5_9MICO|nr:MazG family protein [Georgenia wutianyii]